MRRYYLKKNRSTLILFIVMAVGLSIQSCQSGNDDPTLLIPPEINVEIPQLDFTNDGAIRTFHFNSTGDWKIEVEQTRSDSPWIQVSPTIGKAGQIQVDIQVQKNKSSDGRIGYIYITSEDQRERIIITQEGDGTLGSGTQIFQVGPGGDTIAVKIHRNETYSVDVNIGTSWIKHFITQGEQYDTLKLVIPTNRTLSNRIGEVFVSNSGGDFDSKLSIVQLSPRVPLNLSLSQVSLVDSMTVVAFDEKGQFIFGKDMLMTEGQSLRMTLTPDLNNVRNVYTSSKVYVIANSTIDFSKFKGSESDFLNTRDTAVYQLFQPDVSPTMIGSAIADLNILENNITLDLAPVNAEVKLMFYFDPNWKEHGAIASLSVSGFKTQGHLFSQTQRGGGDNTSQSTLTFRPDKTHFQADILNYKVYAYEGSVLTLTVQLTCGRYIQGTIPTPLERGKSYSFNMMLSPDGTCKPTTNSALKN